MFDRLDAALRALSQVDHEASDAERVDRLAALERVKAACAAAQARITVEFAESQESVAAAWRQRAQECSDEGDFEGWRAARDQARRASPEPAAGLAERPSVRACRRAGADVGVGGQVALARRESPSRGARHVATALALVRLMPHTMAALESGTVSEWRSSVVVRETAMLTPEQRTAVDAELFAKLGGDVGMLGDRELVRRVQAIAYRIDAVSVMARCRGAESQRRVSIPPAPDTMAYLTAYLPVAQGVAVHAALLVAAAAARAAGDERAKAQVMTDTFVERVTGQASATAVPVEVQVVITDRALLTNVFGDDDPTPAQVPGHGTVPAAWVRDLVTRGSSPAGRDDAQVWLRRIFTHPEDGTLVAMESTRRLFDGGLRRFLIARDGTCRTPWCDAPVRHLDHVVEHASGGPTTATNGQGLCVRCNHTKQLPGWRARPEPDPPPLEWRTHTVMTTTPTGHLYASKAPPVLPGAAPGEASVLERHLETLLVA